MKQQVTEAAKTCGSRSEFCRRYKNLYDAARINGWLDELFPRYVRTGNHSVKNDFAMVYLLREIGDPTLCKIGRSTDKNIQTRLYHLRRGCKNPFEVLATCFPKSSRTFESMLLCEFGKPLPPEHQYKGVSGFTEMRILNYAEQASIVRIMSEIDIRYD